jgi:hypothetical protein
MRAYAFSVVVVVFSVAAVGQDCTSRDFAAFSDVQSTVLRLLSSPGYTTVDEKTLNQAGDLAAVAIMRNVSIEAMQTPQNRRQILLILRFAFEAPNLIAGCNRNPTATLLLIDHLQSSNGLQDNELNNTRFLVKNNATTGQPLPPVTGGSQIDWEHTKWVDSVLRWTIDIKVGMTRKDVLRVFTTEGGLSNRRQRTYVLKQCPYIKVDVEFAPVGDAQNFFAESPDDKIITISNPYLQYGHMD